MGTVFAPHFLMAVLCPSVAEADAQDTEYACLASARAVVAVIFSMGSLSPAESIMGTVFAAHFLMECIILEVKCIEAQCGTRCRQAF